MGKDNFMSVITINEPANHFTGILRYNEFRIAKRVFAEHGFAISPVNFSLNDDDGKLVAGFSGKKFGNILEVDLLYVTKELRGQGIGKELINFVSEWGAKNGCALLSLWCGDWHTHQFYRKNNFGFYGSVSNQPAGHEIFYCSKPIDPSSKYGGNLNFAKEGDDFYDKLLPHMQDYERETLPREPNEWPEDAIAFQLNDKKGALGKAFGYTLWNNFYCDGLWFSDRAGLSQRTEFAHGMIEQCGEAGLNGIRVNAFPWQSPDAFIAASFELAGTLENPDSRLVRRTFSKLMHCDA
jgi:GNAT superfamily N-acetyltransferase